MNTKNLLCVVGAFAALGLAGCTSGSQSPNLLDTSNRRPIGPAPAGLPSAGIGAPGGASADTRGVGSVAASEGQSTETAPTIGLGSSAATRR